MTDPEGDRGASRDDETWAPVIYLPGVVPPSEGPLSEGPLSEAPLSEAHLSKAWEPEVQPPGLQAPVAAAHSATARHVAITALGRRGLSRREVERTLRSREFDEDTITEQIESLERAGLLDDLALAQNLVGTLQERKGLGRAAIAAELTRRLLAPAAIEYALELIDTGDELGRARELAVKRAGQLRGYDHETAVRRLSGYLARRGYSGSTVKAAVDQALPRTSGTVRFR